MIGAMIGIFLIVPNAVTLTLLIAIWITTSVQLRLAEEFLSRRHGAAYETYRAQTRRWL
jgi:protein-S-isoprenylcysteine O-methyltransferase Ste14